MSAIIAECRNCDHYCLFMGGSHELGKGCRTALTLHPPDFYCDNFSDDTERFWLARNLALSLSNFRWYQRAIDYAQTDIINNPPPVPAPTLRDLQDLLNEQHNTATDMIRELTAGSSNGRTPAS